MKVISSKSSSTLWTLPESRIITTSNTLRAEDMETLCQNCVLFMCGATGTVQFGLSVCACIIIEVCEPIICVHYNNVAPIKTVGHRY